MRHARSALVALAVVLVLAVPAATAAPREVHLGLPTSDPGTAVSVLFVDDPPAADDASVTLVAPDGEREYAARVVDGPSADVAVYEAVLDGLSPGTAYAYRVGDEEFAFETPPAALAPGEAFTVVALGDMGIRDASRRTAHAVLALEPDLVLHAGDISYAEGDLKEWSQWFAMVEPTAATRPWVTALGNHETYTSAQRGDVAPSPIEVATYTQRFGLPGNEIWYSFDWAGVHFVALDTYSQNLRAAGNGPSAEQLEWLDADLARHANATWTVAFLHEPAYSSNDHGESAMVQETLVPILERHGVDLLVAAHDHGYERSFPVLDGNPTNTHPHAYVEGDGVVHVVTGGGGQSLYEDYTATPPSWSATRASIYHVIHLTITADAIEGRVVPTAGDAFEDAFAIRKTEPAAAADAADDGGVRVPAPGLGIAAAALAAALAAARWERRGGAR